MSGKRQRWAARGAAWVSAGCVALSLSCGLPEFWINNTVSLGGTTPGSRGTVRVAIVNNTQYFVSMTLGAYDPLNDDRVPVYEQLFADADHPDDRLEPGTTSDTFTFTCARAVSLGDRGLIEAIRERDPNAENLTLSEGITFSDKLLDADGVQQFTINGVVNQIQENGIHYQCGSQIIFSLESDASQPNGIRIDVDIALP